VEAPVKVVQRPAAQLAAAGEVGKDPRSDGPEILMFPVSATFVKQGAQTCLQPRGRQWGHPQAVGGKGVGES
jgi:hypothetical protein